MYSSTHTEPQNWGVMPQPLNPCGGGETCIHGTGAWVGSTAYQQLYTLIQNTRVRNFLTLVEDRKKSVDDCNNNVRCDGCFTPQLDIC